VKKGLVIAFALIAVVVLAACVGPPLFESPLSPSAVIDEPAPPAGEVPTLKGAFAIIAAGAVGGIIAFLFERFKWFQNLQGDARFWVVFGLSVGLPVLAQVALQYVPDEVWSFLEPYWQSIALGFLAFLGSQAAHLVDQRLKDVRGIPLRRVGR
jgi:hypothetical protein